MTTGSLARTSYAWVNGLRLHYREWQPEDGPARPALLIHGLASNARIWDQVGPLLADAGLRCVAVDVRGHGLSDKPDSGYDFDTAVSDLAALVDACNLHQPLLIGHSMGAMLAMAYAARFMRGPLAPGGVVMIDGGPYQLDDLPDADWDSVRTRLTPPPLAGTPVVEFIRRIQHNDQGWQPNAASIKSILANFEIDEDDCIHPRLSLERHMQYLRAMWDFRVYEALTRFDQPLMTILARQANPRPETAAFRAVRETGIQRSQGIRPDMQVVWMDDSIHDLPLQRPAELAQLIAPFGIR